MRPRANESTRNDAAVSIAEPVTMGLPYSGRILAGITAMQVALTAHIRPATRPSGEMLRLVGSPPVAIKNVPPRAKPMPITSRVRGLRRSITQVYPIMMTSCRHWSTVAVPAFVRRTAER